MTQETTIPQKIQELLGIDVRSLALFRIVIGLILMIDLILRAQDLTAHYTDFGVLPRSDFYLWFSSLRFQLNLHALGGSLWFESLLFVIAFVFAFLLMIGYWSQLSAFISWLLLISLHDRNILVLSGADILLRVILFWSLFLPLGAFFSVDALTNPHKHMPKRVFSAATIAYLLQICCIYWFSVGFKWNEDWIGGNAIKIALQIDQFATSWTPWLLGQSFLSFLTYLTLAIELVGPLFAFIPIATGPFRFATVLLFSLLHLGFGAFLHLGIFPWVSIASWLPFLPSWFWDRVITSKKAWNEKRPVTSNWFENGVVSFLFVYVIVYNFSTLYFDRFPSAITPRWTAFANILHIDQKWNLFSRPLRDDGWYVVEGDLLNGEKIDLLRMQKGISWNKPSNVASMYANSRWRKYMMNLWWKNFYPYREPYVRYLVSIWDGQHEGLEKLSSVRMYFMLEKIGEDGKIEKPKKVLLYSSGKFVRNTS